VAAVIERYVARYPQQWLVVHKAFDEDAASSAAACAGAAVLKPEQESTSHG
jgi:hypothetical protein